MCDICYVDTWPFSSSHLNTNNILRDSLVINTKICNYQNRSNCDLISTVDLCPDPMVLTVYLLWFFDFASLVVPVHFVPIVRRTLDSFTTLPTFTT